MADGIWAWLRGRTPTQVANRERAGSAPARFALFTMIFWAVAMTITTVLTEDETFAGAVRSSIVSAPLFGFLVHRSLLSRWDQISPPQADPES